MLQINRSELYTLVWDKPLKRIAESYGVDAIRLANACDEFDIPRPLPGYWQKIEYGKPVEQPALENHRFRPDEPVTVVRAPARTLDCSEDTPPKTGRVRSRQTESPAASPEEGMAS